MTTTGAGLVAPSLEIAGQWLTDVPHPTQPWFAYYWDPGGVQGYVRSGVYAIPRAGHPNFPYGHAVGSDRV